MQPVDLFRRDGATAYSHDVQVDDMGIAWVSGDGGTRGYWTGGEHRDPLSGATRAATPLNPIPYARRRLPKRDPADDTGGFEHNAWRPVGRERRRRAYRNGELLLATEEDFIRPTRLQGPQGQFIDLLAQGSYDGEAGARHRRRSSGYKTVGTWNPYKQEGSRPLGEYGPGAEFCSAHYFDVDGASVAYAWYGEGTRFLDISDPANPTQVAYWRPDDGIVWASYLHNGYVYTADHARGVDVLKLTLPATASGARRRAVVAPAPSARHLRFLKRMAKHFRAEPGTRGLCLL